MGRQRAPAVITAAENDLHLRMRDWMSADSLSPLLLVANRVLLVVWRLRLEGCEMKAERADAFDTRANANSNSSFAAVLEMYILISIVMIELEMWNVVT